MEETDERFDEFYKKYMEPDDPVVVAVLRGHLLVEEAMGRVFSAEFHHPSHLDRFSFSQKIAILRALALGEEVCEVLQALNSLRNELAHAFDGPKRAKKLTALRDVLRRHDTDEHKELAGDTGIVISAAAYCHGYLHGFADAMQASRATAENPSSDQGRAKR